VRRLRAHSSEHACARVRSEYWGARESGRVSRVRRSTHRGGSLLRRRVSGSSTSCRGRNATSARRASAASASAAELATTTEAPRRAGDARGARVDERGRTGRRWSWLSVRGELPTAGAQRIAQCVAAVAAAAKGAAMLARATRRRAACSQRAQTAAARAVVPRRPTREPTLVSSAVDLFGAPRLHSPPCSCPLRHQHCVLRARAAPSAHAPRPSQPHRAIHVQPPPLPRGRASPTR
jgi:hypothetical protein